LSFTLDSTLAAVTVLVLSDHVTDGHDRSNDIRRAIVSLRDQEIDEPFDILVCESEHLQHDLAPGLAGLHPRVRIALFPQDASYAIKNAGIASVQTEFVALMDADCVPQVDWLKRMLAAIRTDSKIASVSGRTVYPSDSFAIRACSLLGRAYADPGKPGPTRFIAINNAIFRRTAYLDHPLPVGIGTFSSHIQCRMLEQDGWSLYFDPAIEVRHDFDGWSMEADFRRNCGYGTIRTRLEDGSLPYGWLARCGRLSIPFILGGKLIDSWRDCFRCGDQYGVGGLELLGTMLLSIPLHLLELPGMLQAYHRVPLKHSSFR
jgi:glycosyltransferase involved in cell wall biosynthesis